MKPLVFKVLIVHERDAGGSETYSAQCLNYDLVAQGGTISEVLLSMQRIIRTQVLISLNDCVEPPFSDFEPAPRRFWERYESIKEHEEKAFAFSANVQPGDLDGREIEVSSVMKIESGQYA